MAFHRRLLRSLARRHALGTSTRSFARLWTAETISSLGDGLRSTALSLLAARLSSDPVRVAAVTFAGGLPWLLVSLLAGRVVDRVDRRGLVVRLRLCMAVLTAAVGGLMLTGRATLTSVYIASFGMSLCSTLVFAAYPALVIGVVARENLARANGSLSAGAITAADFVGPPVAGVLFGAVPSLAFFFDALSFVGSAALLRSLEGLFGARTSEGGISTFIRDTHEGLQWMRREPVVLALALTSPVLAVAFLAVFSVQVLFAIDTLNVGGVGFGLLSSAFAAGAIVGGLMSSRLPGLLGPGRALVAGLLTQGAAYGALAVSRHIAAVATLYAVVGCSSLVAAVTSASTYQALTPRALIGRVTAAFNLLSQGARPIGAVAGGLMGRWIGLRALFVVAAVAHGSVGAVLARAASNARIHAAVERFAKEDDGSG